ncbi:MAG: tRNA (adenosine(37)-N6)-threonylcarbamoyltransferase complex ATPase subunit type 1 TsaE [Candidatus Kaiserbacteria bacterium]|nr:tRNA (adenosine(37)-N6)-threonylcarbamoyltransferase complex ATPase subunit type 1 TsaE [Candidatus Kaiserbacteria bacterium]MCB9816486.1 tRNA (adenosine(37)-N6)-threonylcarbamoyltransferase complex ATPase subunit type 1 TsaE [Candidatus Nomurabacteria bacterium]
MGKTYQVSVPSDFNLVANDLLSGMTGEVLVIALSGDLGAGKTTFTQELAKNLGVTEPITSPTFTIMKQYELSHDRFDTLVHIDAYRFEDESEAEPLRLKEVFTQPRTIVCVEWPEQIASYIPESAVRVDISITEGEVRVVTVA